MCLLLATFNSNQWTSTIRGSLLAFAFDGMGLRGAMFWHVVAIR